VTALARVFGVSPTPERPGPGPLPDALLRALELTIGRRVEGLLAGDHRSSLLGRGTEFAQIRPYVPGDDVRLIDWNVTARTGQPHVRVQLAERVLVTWLVLDRTASMRFGTALRRKDDVALGAAVAVGHAASIRGNRVGLVAFGEGPPGPLAPRPGRPGLLGLLVATQEPGPGAAGTLGGALEVVGATAVQRALVAVVSDFRGPVDWERPLLDLAGRHHVLALEVRDPREQELPDVGELWLVDPETGRKLRVDTRNPRLRERFATAAREERSAVAARLQRVGATHAVLTTDGDWLRTLAAALRAGR
jgi:uncharacterized protein (DUF58 family)